MVIPDSGLFATTNNRPEASSVEVAMSEDLIHELLILAEEPKQILVDPISLKASSLGEASFNVMLPPVITARDHNKFISCSLPNSASSSPRFSFSQLKKKLRNESRASPQQINPLRHQQQLTHLRRTRSYAEGKLCPPSDEFDIWFSKPKLEPSKAINTRFKEKDSEEEFKCGALCLYLPGFGKGKPVRSKKLEPPVGNVISRTVSLERFECGSWASSAIHEEDGERVNLYFDLPVELIRSTVNDAHSPVTAAFIFNKDRRGVLKRGSTKKSHDSPHRVRFSISSALSPPSSPGSCVTPRLRKAREDFNAFLQVQSA